MSKQYIYTMGGTAIKSDAPNLRDVPEAKTCSNCDNYDYDYGWCEKHGFSVYCAAEKICDDWKSA